MLSQIYCYRLILTGLFILCVSRSSADEINFNRDIRPILSDRCFACHGPNDDSNESGLRLDLENAAKGELPSGNGFAIVPGDVSNSELINRILSDDDSIQRFAKRSYRVLRLTNPGRCFQVRAILAPSTP